MQDQKRQDPRRLHPIKILHTNIPNEQLHKRPQPFNFPLLPNPQRQIHAHPS